IMADVDIGGAAAGNKLNRATEVIIDKRSNGREHGQIVGNGFSGDSGQSSREMFCNRISKNRRSKEQHDCHYERDGFHGTTLNVSGRLVRRWAIEYEIY